MIGEIIAIGDELTSGRITNTTSGLAARELFLLGHEIRAMHTVGDEPELIGETLKKALSRADFLIVTGGLGATSDDLTNEAVIAALGLHTAVHPGVQANIEARWGKRQPENVRTLAKLALLPEGAEVLDSDCRMAGYLLRHQGKPIFFLPGVPPQMEILLRSRVLPGLAEFGGRTLPVAQRLYRTCGLYEIEINRLLAPLEEQGELTIGYYPVCGEVHVSLTGRHLQGGSEHPRFQEADRFIREVLGEHLYGTDDETLAGVTGRLLVERGLTLGVAESCTGGLISAALTESAGASRWFAGGMVTYANRIKETQLGVAPALLARFGAVSGECARAMAQGAAQRLGCPVAVSATGIAGPDGGSADKPVGTVYLGLALAGRVSDRQLQLSGSRRQIQLQTVQAAVDLVRRTLLVPTSSTARSTP